MNSLKAFFKEKGLYLLCLTLVFAVTIVGVLAVRSVVNNVADLTQARQRALEEDSKWTLPDTTVDKPQQDVPITATPAPGQPSSASSAPASSPRSPSGASSASAESSAASAGSGASQTPSITAPVASASSEPVAPFSGEELVYNETLGDWRTHNGADYAAQTGESVYAVQGGKISAVYEDVLWGGVVEVTTPDGVQWKYCGVADPRLKQGEQAAKGEKLGSVGGIPSESKAETHLHVECNKDGKYLDPQKQ